MSTFEPVHAPAIDSDEEHSDPRIPDAIEKLINLCADGVEGHKRSAALVEDTVAKSLFELWSRERADFLTALTNLGARHGAEVDEPGTAAGSAHRVWLSAIEKVSGDDAVIGAAENGEGVALEAYESALELDLPADVRKVVQQQYEQIRDIRDRLANWSTV